MKNCYIKCLDRSKIFRSLWQYLVCYAIWSTFPLLVAWRVDSDFFRDSQFLNFLPIWHSSIPDQLLREKYNALLCSIHGDPHQNSLVLTALWLTFLLTRLSISFQVVIKLYIPQIVWILTAIFHCLVDLEAC